MSEPITIPPNTIFYMLSQQGCHACALTRPVFRAFQAKYFIKIVALEMDVNRVDQVDGWEPKSTPAFAVKASGVLMATTEGSMTLEQMEKFVIRAIAGKPYDPNPPPRKKTDKPPVKREKKPAVTEDDEDEEDEDEDEEEDEPEIAAP